MSQTELPTLPRIYETYRAKVRAYAAKLIGRDDADDVAQEVFIKIGRSLESLEDPAKLTSWIYAITLNTVRDLARKRASRFEAPSPCSLPGPDKAEDDDALSRLPDGRSRSPEEAAMRNEMVACYLDYVEALPANYYDVYVLAELEELTNEEIAQRLELTLGTVKIRLHRARTRLFDQLRRDCQCFYSERGELMGRPKDDCAQQPPPRSRKRPRQRA
ncbi:MAG: RNA polymerase sigma factor [Thermoanaerobaculales bacterium]